MKTPPHPKGFLPRGKPLLRRLLLAEVLGAPRGRGNPHRTPVQARREAAQAAEAPALPPAPPPSEG